MEKYLDKQGLVAYTHKMKQYINSKVPSAASSIADGETGFVTGDQVYDALQTINVQTLSENEIREIMAGIHIDWYKVSGEKINNIEPTSETTCDFHQYIVETDLETNEEKIIHIVGSAEYYIDTEEPYSDVSVNSANYVTMSGSTITETLGTVSGISVTSTFDDSTGDIHLTTAYKGLSLSEVINIDESQDTTQQG